jgi:hypothetical protein
MTSTIILPTIYFRLYWLDESLWFIVSLPPELDNLSPICVPATLGPSFHLFLWFSWSCCRTRWYHIAPLCKLCSNMYVGLVWYSPAMRIIFEYVRFDYAWGAENYFILQCTSLLTTCALTYRLNFHGICMSSIPYVFLYESDDLHHLHGQ